MDDLAVEISFHADHDNFQGQLKTLSRNIDKAFELLRLAVCEPRLDDDAIERVRAQIDRRPEARGEGSRTGSRAAPSARTRFPTIPMDGPSQGTLESAPDDHARRSRRHAPQRPGARQPQDRRGRRHRRGAPRAHRRQDVFGALPAQAKLVAVPDVAPGGRHARVIEVDVPQSTIRFGLPGISRTRSRFHDRGRGEPHSRRRRLLGAPVQGSAREARTRLFRLTRSCRATTTRRCFRAARRPRTSARPNRCR